MFFIDLEDVDTSRVGTYYRDALEMRLYYFAANTYTGYIDLIHKRDELIRMLQGTTRLSDDEEDELYDFVIQAMMICTLKSVRGIRPSKLLSRSCSSRMMTDCQTLITSRRSSLSQMSDRQLIWDGALGM